MTGLVLRHTEERIYGVKVDKFTGFSTTTVRAFMSPESTLVQKRDTAV